MSQSVEQRRALLNAQTGKIQWPELQRHFARGVVIKVAPDMDLVQVAERMVADDKATIETWMDEGRIARADEQDAQHWTGNDTVFWAVVVAPWVLVQPVNGDVIDADATD